MKEIQKKQKSVEEKKSELKSVLPFGEEGLPVLSIQSGDVTTTINIPCQSVIDVLKKIGLTNRTIFEVFGIKIGIDVL